MNTSRFVRLTGLLFTLFVFVSLQPLCAALPRHKVVKILAIGNSFSEDAVEQYLHELAAADGYQAVVANMYIGGCSLEKHYNNMQADAPAYRYRKIGTDGRMHEVKEYRLSQALADEDWDYVSLQQVSHLSGMPQTYEAYLPALMDYVKRLAPHARLLWHQTWAYARVNKHGGFKNYGSSQEAMYDAIISTTKLVRKQYGIRTIIPCGTAIQNARTSYLGDNLCRDGFHLDKLVGRYTAACTWYERIFGRKVVGNAYRPAGLEPDRALVAQWAAHTAVRHPYRVTNLGTDKYRRKFMR